MVCFLLMFFEPQLGDDFCPAALGSFLLGYGIIGTGQPGLATIPTRLLTITTDLCMVELVKSMKMKVETRPTLRR